MKGSCFIPEPYGTKGSYQAFLNLKENGFHIKHINVKGHNIYFFEDKAEDAFIYFIKQRGRSLGRATRSRFGFIGIMNQFGIPKKNHKRILLKFSEFGY
jgi:hypothetical protein